MAVSEDCLVGLNVMLPEPDLAPSCRAYTTAELAALTIRVGKSHKPKTNAAYSTYLKQFQVGPLCLCAYATQPCAPGAA